MTILAVAGAYTLARYADDAFAGALGHPTLRHGTDPVSWLAIHMFGSSASKDHENLWVTTENREYGVTLPLTRLIKMDSLPDWLNRSLTSLHTRIMGYRINQLLWQGVKIVLPILKRGPIFYLFKKTLMHALPFAQKMVANYRRIHEYTPIEGIGKMLLVTPLALFAAIITPTIKFRGPEKAFIEPKNLAGRVVLVHEGQLSALNIGLVGTLRHSLRLPPLFSQPGRMLKGAIKLTLASTVAYGAITFCPAFVAAHQTAILASSLFAVI